MNKFQIHSLLFCLTSTILVAEIRKSPDVTQSNCKTEAGQNKLDRIVPLPSRLRNHSRWFTGNFINFVVLFIALQRFLKHKCTELMYVKNSAQFEKFLHPLNSSHYFKLHGPKVYNYRVSNSKVSIKLD